MEPDVMIVKVTQTREVYTVQTAPIRGIDT